MFPLYLVLLILLGIPALFALLYLNMATISLGRLGLSGEAAFFLFALSLLGSVVNIPVASRQIITRRPLFTQFPVFFYYPPVIQEQVVAINLGGAVIPVMVSLYLLPRTPLLPLLAAIAVVSLVSYLVARPVPGRGILLPAFIPPLTAALSALAFSRAQPAAVAYISGTIGTLIGADLLHLKDIQSTGAGLLSIGGAGVYDGIFLAGLIAAFLA